jgi:hypothetical protein
MSRIYRSAKFFEPARLRPIHTDDKFDAKRPIGWCQERRTALLFTAVTGKTDVREFATDAIA